MGPWLVNIKARTGVRILSPVVIIDPNNPQFLFTIRDWVNLPQRKFSDGCGLINAAALTAIWNSEILKLPYRPVAVQSRMAGVKSSCPGTFTVHI